MEIRKAQITDIEKLLEIDTVVPIDPTRVNYIEEAVSSGAAWVSIVDDHLIGYAVLNRSLFSRPTIEMIMIAADRRRSGVGVKLMEHLEQICDGNELWTSTNLSNTPMQQLLARLGYKITGFVDNLDPGDPELIYFKRLKEA